MRKIKVLTIIALTTIVLSGCNSTKKMTYVIENDEEQIRFDVSDKYDIDDKSPFTITKDGKAVCRGIFVNSTSYNSYIIAILGDEGNNIIEQEKTKTNEYIFYQTSGDVPEYNYFIKFKKTGNGLIVQNKLSKESAIECFSHLKF